MKSWNEKRKAAAFSKRRKDAYAEKRQTWGSNATPFAWLGGCGVMRVNAPATTSSQFSIFNSQLYLTRHRLYAPVLRRFLSADPLGIDGGLNLYAYANGSPLAYVDPLGLCAMDGSVPGFFEMIGSGLATAGECLARGIDGAWNLTLELMASNPNFRESGAQNAVYQVIVGEWGSPLRRLGAYEEAPIVAAPEIVDALWDLGAAASVYRNLGTRTVSLPRNENSGVIHVTPQGVSLPAVDKYRSPSSYVDNPYRSGSYGMMIDGRFREFLRIDPPTPPGKNGPGYSHYHLNGGHEHLSPRDHYDPGF